MCYSLILFLLELWHIAVMTDLKPILNTIVGSGSKRGGLGTFVEMSQAVMPVIEPGMFVLYFPVCQA